MSRIELARSALRASISWRRKADVSLYEPINPVDIALGLSIQVRFVDISMEGMYQGGSKPTILLSSLRPPGRRNFTCAHELGHHAFGHGSTIDELQESSASSIFNSEEFLADVFAGHFLMPIPAIKQAFADRGTSIENTTPALVLRVASAFGVGYEALVSHLSATNNLPTNRANELRKAGMAGARSQFLGFIAAEHLLVLDEQYTCKTADVEVGQLVSLPTDVVVSGSNMILTEKYPTHHLYKTEKPGICRATSEAREWSAFIRICRHAYIGLAGYRHLEDDHE